MILCHISGHFWFLKSGQRPENLTIWPFLDEKSVIFDEKIHKICEKIEVKMWSFWGENGLKNGFWSKKVGFWPFLFEKWAAGNRCGSRVCGFFGHFPTFFCYLYI